MPSQFLQLRDLHPETTAQHIVTALTKLQDVSIRRLLLVTGREDEHVPIAFAEFLDSNAAGRVLALAAALPGKGFSVKGKPAGLSYIHGGVFMPVYGHVKSGIFKATNSTQLLSYWNSDYQCSVFIPEGAIPEDQDQPEQKRKGSDDHAKRKKLKPLGSGVTTKSGSGGMISHWSKKQDELNSDSHKGSNTVSYADTKILACLLCSRKFKSEVELFQHETQSDLHKTNLGDTKLVDKAQKRLQARAPGSDSGKAETITTGPQDPSSDYRDRAMERRVQIKQAGGTIEQPKARHKRTSREPSPPEPTKAVSKGSQLLSKMGYVSGGLGSSGQGRSEAVKAEGYIQGVGLGAAGGKLDEKALESRTNAGSSYAAFVASVKENARARYESGQ